MSFGTSISDIVLLTQLAWNTYKACKEAPGDFANLVQDTQSLHAILQETEDTVREGGTNITERQHQRLQGVMMGCRNVLEDLGVLLQKYESLSTQSKRSWDRMGYAWTNISDLRSRLTTQTLLLTSFLQTSQISVEIKLRKLIKEVQEGKHEKSELSFDSLNTIDRQRWRAIRKQLEAAGITIAAFEENSTFIVDYINKAIASGQLQEHKPRPPSSREETTSTGSTLPAIKGSARPRTASERTHPFTKLRLTKREPAIIKSPPTNPPPKVQLQDGPYKVLMLGISEAGKTTVLNQLRLLSQPYLHPSEYADVRKNLLQKLIGNLRGVINQLEQNQAEQPMYYAPVVFKTFLQLTENLDVYADETSPRVMKALRLLRNDPNIDWAFRSGLFRFDLDVGPTENFEYLYKNMDRIAASSKLNNEFFLKARVMTLGVTETLLTFDDKSFNLVDVPGERIGRRKWDMCKNGIDCITMSVSLTAYCSNMEDMQFSTRPLSEAITVADNTMDKVWLKSQDPVFVLYLTKLDLLDKTLSNYPLAEYASGFSFESWKEHDPSLSHQDWHKNMKAYSLAFIANQFVTLAKKHNRILQVHCIDATNPSSRPCLEESLKFISGTIPKMLSGGTGLLLPCAHCPMGDLFDLDHFRVPSEPLTWISSGETEEDHETEPGGSGSPIEAQQPSDMSPPPTSVLDWHGVHVQEVKTIESTRNLDIHHPQPTTTSIRVEALPSDDDLYDISD